MDVVDRYHVLSDKSRPSETLLFISITLIISRVQSIMAAQQRSMKVAVLTSGGDSAGMNAVVRAVARSAILRFDLISTARCLQLQHQSSPSEGAKRGWSAKATRDSFAATLMGLSSPRQRPMNRTSFYFVICDLGTESC